MIGACYEDVILEPRRLELPSSRRRIRPFHPPWRQTDADDRYENRPRYASLRAVPLGAEGAAIWGAAPVNQSAKPFSLSMAYAGGHGRLSEEFPD